MEITITDALVIKASGWYNEEEKELHDIACLILRRDKDRLVLKYKKEKKERELLELEQQLDIPVEMRHHNSKPVEISDEEIEKESRKESHLSSSSQSFIRGVKWYREQLKNK